jgi:hypothetical protein
MKHAASRELFTYWDHLRRDRSAPERNDVDPSDIRAVLIDTFVLEIDTARQYPLRLVGDRTNCLFLSELKGKSFLDLWAPEDRDDIRLILSSVADEANPVIAGATAAAFGRAQIDLEILLLPLKHNGRTHARMLGCIAPYSLPSWFGLLPVEDLKLGTMRSVRMGDLPDDMRDVRADAFLSPGRAMNPENMPVRRRHLLVFNGGL